MRRPRVSSRAPYSGGFPHCHEGATQSPHTIRSGKSLAVNSEIIRLRHAEPGFEWQGADLRGRIGLTLDGQIDFLVLDLLIDANARIVTFLEFVACPKLADVEPTIFVPADIVSSFDDDFVVLQCWQNEFLSAPLTTEYLKPTAALLDSVRQHFTISK